MWEVELVPNSDGTGDAESRAVLKDVWLDEDAPTEREVQEAIYKAIEDRKADIDSHKGIGQVMGSAKLLKLRQVPLVGLGRAHTSLPLEIGASPYSSSRTRLQDSEPPFSESRHRLLSIIHLL